MKMAIIMCCYNRKKLTERSVQQLNKSVEKYPDIHCKIYVCDDGSTDGTCEMLREEFNNVIYLKGSGRLYWCKSMHLAMKTAVQDMHDYYLMVNDDTDFKDNVIKIMMDSYQQAKETCGIVGAMSFNKICTYGGRNIDNKLLLPNGKLQSCVLANWNCFLISREVVDRVGIIDEKYQHAYGDFDYSHRMLKAGIPIYVATEYVGEAQRNSEEGTFQDYTLKRFQRLRLLLSPKGMPIYSYFRYHIRSSGVKGLPRYIYGYLSVVGYIILKKEFKKKD